MTGSYSNHSCERRCFRAMVAAAFIVGGVSAAVADGALYVATPKKGLRDGFAYGFAYNLPAADAKTKAKKVCEDQALSVNIRAGACQLIEAFAKRCVAVAMDTENKWAGWSTGASKDEANTAAIAACAKEAPACAVHESVCDE